MTSEARAVLVRTTEEQSTDGVLTDDLLTDDVLAGGVLRVGALDGYELPPGSMNYPPCQCPQHRAAQVREDIDGVLSAGGREVGERGTGERP
ncbi:hypothetical protein ACFQ7F_09055 [Streptomyces sp. NPDC056486]|uniref:hypothetical protein n=1 Tax=Streptomyces sp. NPDC056486 TaxID=3345835 RepID=UPI0036899E6A